MCGEWGTVLDWGGWRCSACMEALLTAMDALDEPEALPPEPAATDVLKHLLWEWVSARKDHHIYTAETDLLESRTREALNS